MAHSAVVSLGLLSRPGPIFAGRQIRSTPSFELSLAPWSLMRRPFGQADPQGIDLFDYPMIAKELAFDFIEQDNLHFPGDLPVDRDIVKMKDRCEAAGIRNSLLLCGALGDVADVDKKKRKRAIRKYIRWIAAAEHLGCESVRVVCADRVSVSNEEKLKFAVEGVSKLVRYAARKDINLLIENHNGYSSDPDWLVRLIREVDHPRCGILADFTEWRMRRDPVVLYPDPYQGIEILAPYTRSVGAKSTHFDQSGNETNVDYFRMMEIILGAGFKGKVAVEYFGEDLPRKEGIRLTKDLLERVREQLS